MPANKSKGNISLLTQPKRNEKFEEIQRKNQEILKQRVENMEDSDSDEEIDKIKVDALFKNYTGNESDILRIQKFFESGENIDCLICIRKVKAKDKIWNCKSCYCFFHLLCIQKWANDSMNQKRLYADNQPAGYYSNTGVFVQRKLISISWDCPQCRKSYESDEIPRHYECYCGKERDPLYQDWIPPHSCGNHCGKELQPKCGHRCVLLCHPGTCPSCPQIIQKSCKCGKSPIKTIRCSQQSWTCAQKCSKLLSCGIHNCSGTCHGLNECPPCTKTSKKPCACGSQLKEISCEKKTWSCQKICGKSYSCGLHSCSKTCHSGECGDCVFGLTRTCYCGKQTYLANSCKEAPLESCGDTCFKVLSCGNVNHKCQQRCHKGECGPCTELVEKKCRCGMSSKENPCSKELLCEIKCKNMKSCEKHNCNRKCCGNECPPCDKICGKTLSCGKHKCSALCHDGRCYPCTLKQQIKCRCGTTTISVLCGQAKKNRYPKCREFCKLPSKCHHENLPHHCHPGDCSSCVQICNEELPCTHLCLSKCHDYVRIVTKDKNFVKAGPWDFAEEKVEMKKLPHPPCLTLVPVVCIGGHETMNMECCQAKSRSCGRQCDRLLTCSNHRCTNICHQVSDVESKLQDENCDDCQSPCTLARPIGCKHSCPKSCHPAPCKKCQVQIKSKCFCGLTDVYFRCCDVYKRKSNCEEDIENLKQKYLCCGSKCIKNYACGHQCTSICHPGDCPDADLCSRKVKLICACKTRRMEITCDKVRAEKITSIACDETCESKRRIAEEEKENMLKEKLRAEAEKNQRELEEFEKKFGKKKYKERKRKVVEEEKDNKKLIIISALSVLLISMTIYFILA